MINVKAEKNPNESPASVLRRFTKGVQESGVLTRVRGIRYAARTLSPYKVKMATLDRLERKAARDVLAKLGKLPVNTKRRR